MLLAFNGSVWAAGRAGPGRAWAGIGRLWQGIWILPGHIVVSLNLRRLRAGHYLLDYLLIIISQLFILPPLLFICRQRCYLFPLFAIY